MKKKLNLFNLDTSDVPEIRPWKIKLCLHKAYFDHGMSKTQYVKWIIAYYGITANDVTGILVYAGIYGVLAYLFGMFWVRHMMEAEAEIGNRFNSFVKEMRNWRKRSLKD